MKKRAIMVQGTGSNVGKSLIVTALCRIFRQDGYRVAPFKAQNMSLNSFVTKKGHEIARAQATQAEAGGVEPVVDMNPVLLKPTSDQCTQVIVMGRPIGNMEVIEYHNYKPRLLGIIKESFERLSKEYDIVVIEGAGSPCEVNLKENDLVNMRMAGIADCPVLMVGDIDRGGVFAWLVGTLELLSQDERDRVKGIIINKFRGRVKILRPGLTFLENKTHKPVLGVIPYIEDLMIAKEDSMCLGNGRSNKRDGIRIEILCLPHISNFTDFDPLEREVDLRYVRKGERISDPDCLIIPGSKNTIDDLIYLRRSGYEEAILRMVRNGTIVGICGGYQMLGREVMDPYGVDGGKRRAKGFGLLPITTIMGRDKVTNQVEAEDLIFHSGRIIGYEIHMGRSKTLSPIRPAFKILRRSDMVVDVEDGAIGEEGKVWGTYIHGLFENDGFRRGFINSLQGDWNPWVFAISKDKEYDRLADVVRENLKMNKIYELLFKG